MFSLIMAILSFFLSKKAGMSNGQAALVAGAAGLATWATIDPMNENAIWKPFHKEPGSTSLADNVTSSAGVPSTGKTPGDVIAGLGDNAKDVLVNWGAGGTLGVVAGGSVIGSVTDAFKKLPGWVQLGLVGGVAYLILKD